MSHVIEYAGRRYLSVDALRSACKDPAVLAEVLFMLKAGCERGDTVGNVLGVAIASVVAVTAGDIPPRPLDPTTRAAGLLALEQRTSPTPPAGAFSFGGN